MVNTRHPVTVWSTGVHYRIFNDNGEQPWSHLNNSDNEEHHGPLPNRDNGVHYMSSSNSGEPPCSTILSLVTVVHYLTASDNAEPSWSSI